MYALMSIETLIRIAFAMAFLFVIIPALAWPRRRTATGLEWFFWNLGVGITLITLLGQVLTLARLFSFLTLILIAVLIVLFARAAYRRVSPWWLVRQSAERSFLAVLNVFDGRVNVPRRMRRRYRRIINAMREATSSRIVRLQIVGWSLLVAIAAGFRLYRPLVSANLGYSDTYVHLYLVKLLEDGRQVDPEWGPYPRGMHFLLLAIHELTNVDQILLMNFFGAIAGILIALSVADAARRLSNSVVAGLLAGVLFATLVGGPGQYFVLGGVFASDDAVTARTYGAMQYAQVPGAGEFDIVLTAFHRQTSTLSQELAIVLLFPAAMFLLDFLRRKDRWHLAGFAGCTAAIAAVHSGVLVPLVMMSALILIALAIERRLDWRSVRRSIAAGFLAVLVGSTWMLAFIAYPYAGGKSPTSAESSVGNTALYYFPFLRSLAGESDDARIYVTLTPFLIFCILVAVALVILAIVRRDESHANRIWIASVFLLFLLFHFASMLGIFQVVEMHRNSQWLTMSMAILIGVGAAEVGALLRFTPRLRAAAAVVALFVLLAWMSRVPRLNDPAVHDRIVNYSGYGASALAVVRIERSLEPYTWTIVSYGQEFPMVMRRGFHLSAIDFLERYDPGAEVIPIPTRYVFIIVEKTPHHFQINTWARRFSRADLEQRLQTWVHLYQTTHRNMRVFLEDDHVRVYQIERTPKEIEEMSRRSRGNDAHRSSVVR